MGGVFGHGNINGNEYVENFVGTIDLTSPTAKIEDRKSVV